jgi:hypothetical protein
MKRFDASYFLLLFVGAVIGGIMGELLSKQLPVLGRGYPLGIRPASLDLKIFFLTFGLQFKVSLSSVIGLLMAVLVAERRR